MLIIDNDENFLSIKELLKKREDSLLKNEEEIKSFLLLNNHQAIFLLHLLNHLTGIKAQTPIQ